MDKKILDLSHELVNGIKVQLPNSEPVYSEQYFEWTASSLTAAFKSNDISGGVLQAWRHAPVFCEIENHIDAEMFYFVSGTAIMLFMDIKDDEPDISTAQIVRVKPGTQIIIEAGKGHFVPVAETSEPVMMIVVSPKMDAPRKKLSEIIKAV